MKTQSNVQIHCKFARFNFVITCALAIVGLTATAYGDESCLRLLNPKLSSSQQLASSDVVPSNNALTAQSQQYLRLVEYALERTTEMSAIQSLLQDIQVATLVPAPVNVFANQTSVMGAQLNQVVNRLDIGKNLASDWPAVQKQLQHIVNRFKEARTAREQNEGDTEWVRGKGFYEAHRILIHGEVSSTPKWQQIGNHWYLAVGSNDNNIYVLKFDKDARSQDEVLTVAGVYLTGDAIHSSPSWQQIGTQWYLAVGSRDNKIYVFKFDYTASIASEALTVAGEYSTGGSIASSPSWQQIGNDWFVAVGSSDGSVYVLKFDLNVTIGLAVSGVYQTHERMTSSPSWQQIDGNWYLAVGSWNNSLYVFKFDLNTGDSKKALIRAGQFVSGSSIYSSPRWQQIGSDWYLAVGSNDSKVYVLKINLEATNILSIAGAYLTGSRGQVGSSPSWQNIGNSWYLGVGSRNGKVYVLKFVRNPKYEKDALTVVGEYQTNAQVESSSPSWQQIENEWFLAVGSWDQKVYVFKFNEKREDSVSELTLVSEYRTNGWVDSSPSWQKIGSDWYLAIGSDDKNLHLIKFGKTVRRSEVGKE